MPEPPVRPLRSQELPAAAALHALCFPEESWSADSLGRLLALPGVGAWVAEDEAAALEGLLLARLAADEAEVLTLCVAPARRRRGRALALLQAALPALAARGAARLLLEVAADNAGAQALYGRLGFGLVGRRRAYYSRRQGPAVDALLLALDLA